MLERESVRGGTAGGARPIPGAGAAGWRPPRGDGDHAAPTGRPAVRWALRAGIALTLAACTVLVIGPFTPGTVGGAAIAMMLVLILLKVPIGIALAAPGVLGLFGLYGFAAAENLFGHLPYETVASWEYSVIPMFVFMGLLLWKAGVTEQLYAMLRRRISRVPGGLAVVTNGAGAGLAAVSGSTVGTVHALARIGIPEMLRAGYDKRLAVGAVVAASLPGQIIPPSIFLVIYAGLAQTPVGPQLIAGIAPGVLLVLCMAGTVILLCTLRPALGGRAARVAEAENALAPQSKEVGAAPDTQAAPVVPEQRMHLWPLGLLAVAVLGGMYTGAVTVTEAGAVGAAGAVLLTLWYRRGDRPLATVAAASAEALKSMGSIFFLFIGAMALSAVLAVSGIGPGFAEWITGLGLSRVEFLLIVLAAYLVMGMFMDPLSIMLLTVPLLVPVLGDMGVSPLWFGVFAVILAETAIITPPVGVLAFIVADIVREPEVGLGQDIGLGDTFRGIALFLPTVAALCILLILVPGIATFLPDRM